MTKALLTKHKQWIEDSNGRIATASWYDYDDGTATLIISDDTGIVCSTMDGNQEGIKLMSYINAQELRKGNDSAAEIAHSYIEVLKLLRLVRDKEYVRFWNTGQKATWFEDVNRALREAGIGAEEIE